MNGLLDEPAGAGPGGARSSLPGLEDAVMLRPGYAVEYDFRSTDRASGHSRRDRVSGLFLPGRSTGRQGTRRPPAQGLVAGINAALGRRSPAVLPSGRGTSAR